MDTQLLWPAPLPLPQLLRPGWGLRSFRIPDETATSDPMLDVQLWQFAIPQDPDMLPAFSSMLPVEERRIAESHSGQSKRHFVFGRCSLRLLLGEALHLEPQRVPILLGACGKPFTPSQSGNEIFYSVAHSEHVVLIGLSRVRPLGVDLERITRALDFDAVAAAWFSVPEKAALNAVADRDARCALFYRYWTRRESVAKAHGTGLPGLNNAVNVAARPSSEGEVRVELGSETSANTYILHDLELGAGLVGAVAVESH